MLQGTVRREGDFIRVTIEVSDPIGFVLWFDRIDAPSSERMHLQERIAATILSRVKLDSSRMRAMHISPRPVAMEARAKVHRARQLADLQTPDALRNALSLFPRSIAWRLTMLAAMRGLPIAIAICSGWA